MSESELVIAEEPEAAEEGIAAPQPPKFNVYVGMLLFAFVGIGIACFLMYRELQTYNFEKEAPAVAPLPPDRPIAPVPEDTAAPGTATTNPAGSN